MSNRYMSHYVTGHIRAAPSPDRFSPRTRLLNLDGTKLRDDLPENRPAEIGKLQLLDLHESILRQDSRSNSQQALSVNGNLNDHVARHATVGIQLVQP